MTVQGYLTCITCHFDGGDDGQVYDFTEPGEGLRNTISLRGRRGMGQGNLLWSGAFDEVQDFEDEIRGLFMGHGFIADDALAKGTRAQAARRSQEGAEQRARRGGGLPDDARPRQPEPLPQPRRHDDGRRRRRQGAVRQARLRLLPRRQGLHRQRARPLARRRHAQAELAARATACPLLGLDTPSLLGVWETAPYLHDGSAATLRDVLTTAQPQRPARLHELAQPSSSSTSSSPTCSRLTAIKSCARCRSSRRYPMSGGAGGAGSDAGADRRGADRCRWPAQAAAGTADRGAAARASSAARHEAREQLRARRRQRRRRRASWLLLRRFGVVPPAAAQRAAGGAR